MSDDHNHEIVMRIIRAKDHWEVLGISKSESVEHASKCFKRLSIKVHPDKCKHPKAEDAFKKLNEAKRVLTDERLRERYLHTGSADEQPRMRSHNGFGGGGGSTYYNPYTGRYYYQSEDPMEDFMRAFFGAQFSQQRAYQRRPQTRQQPRASRADDDEDTDFDIRSVRWAPLLQLLLMFFVFLMPTLISAFSGGSSKQMYSLKQTDDFPIEMQTLTGNIRYYLPRDFDTSIIGTVDDQNRFEKPIIEAWKHWKRVECMHEGLHKERMAAAASNDVQRRKVEEFVKKSCEDLETFSRSAR